MNKNDMKPAAELNKAPRDNRTILNKHNKPSEYYRIKNQLRSSQFTNPISQPSPSNDLKLIVTNKQVSPKSNLVYLNSNYKVKNENQLENRKIKNSKKGKTLNNISITVTDNQAGDDK